MFIKNKLHNLIERFEICVSKFNPTIHKFRFGMGYIRDEIEWILEQLHLDNFCQHQINIKLIKLISFIDEAEKNLNISSISKDTIIEDNKTNTMKNVFSLTTVSLANGDIVYYNDIVTIPNITYSLKTDVVIKDTDDLPEVMIKTFFNGQPTNHKDIVSLKISKPNNDIVIE